MFCVLSTISSYVNVSCLIQLMAQFVISHHNKDFSLLESEVYMWTVLVTQQNDQLLVYSEQQARLGTLEIPY